MDSNLYRLFVRQSPARYAEQARILQSEVAIHTARGESEEAALKANASVYCIALMLETAAWLMLLPLYAHNDPRLS